MIHILFKLYLYITVINEQTFRTPLVFQTSTIFSFIHFFRHLASVYKAICIWLAHGDSVNIDKILILKYVRSIVILSTTINYYKCVHKSDSYFYTYISISMPFPLLLKIDFSCVYVYLFLLLPCWIFNWNTFRLFYFGYARYWNHFLVQNLTQTRQVFYHWALYITLWFFCPNSYKIKN